MRKALYGMQVMCTFLNPPRASQAQTTREQGVEYFTRTKIIFLIWINVHLIMFLHYWCGMQLMLSFLMLPGLKGLPNTNHKERG